jgi:hypothetical protein
MKIPVRVVRGSELNGKYAPNEGYRYDGLYWVTKIFTDFISKRNIYQFRLVQLDLDYNIPVHEIVKKQGLISPKNPILRKIKKEEEEKYSIILDDDEEEEKLVEVKLEEKLVEVKLEEKQEEKQEEKPKELKEKKPTLELPPSERELKELNSLQDNPTLLLKLKEIKKKKNIFKVRINHPLIIFRNIK